MLTAIFITIQGAILTATRSTLAVPRLTQTTPATATGSRGPGASAGPISFSPDSQCRAASRGAEWTTPGLMEQTAARLPGPGVCSALTYKSVCLPAWKLQLTCLGRSREKKKSHGHALPWKKNSRKQNTTTSFYFVFFGNYTKDEKLIINISQSPPANSNYNRLNNKW